MSTHVHVKDEGCSLADKSLGGFSLPTPPELYLLSVRQQDGLRRTCQTCLLLQANHVHVRFLICAQIKAGGRVPLVCAGGSLEMTTSRFLCSCEDLLMGWRTWPRP